MAGRHPDGPAVRSAAGTMSGMETGSGISTAEYVAVLREEGRLLGAAAERGGWEAPVGACPGWRMRDLVAHTGGVHRWAALYLAGATSPVRPRRAETSDGERREWFHEGHRALADALETAPAGLECWTFLPAASPLEFRARRQAHETAVHRIDAERAADGRHSPVDPRFAVDGVDELLSGFLCRARGGPRAELATTLRVRATDAGGRSWLLRIDAGTPVTERDGDGPADCTVSGPAAALYLRSATPRPRWQVIRGTNPPP